jgi:MoxR-like ATPase
MVTFFLDNLNENQLFNLNDAHGSMMRLREQIIANDTEVSGKDKTENPLVGLEDTVDKVLACLIVNGHALLEGNPGLAKTLLCKTVAKMTGLAFVRVQFTPDLQPSDLVSGNTVTFEGGIPAIRWKPGPIFTNILLGDELNRASPKVQSATLEATEERSVTPFNRPKEVIRPKIPLDEADLLERYGPYYGMKKIGATGNGAPKGNDKGDKDGQVFMVLATQNPIEQEGVYPLAEAQLDRFMFKIIFNYPELFQLSEISKHAFFQPLAYDDNREIIKDDKAINEANHVKALYFFTRLRQLLLGKEAWSLWKDAHNERLRSRIECFIAFTHARPVGAKKDETSIASLGMGQRKSPQSETCDQLLKKWRVDGTNDQRDIAEKILEKLRHPDYPEVETGSSPRGLLKLIQAIHAWSFLKGKISNDGKCVNPTWDDVKAVSKEVLSHRVRLTIGSRTLGGTPDRVIEDLLESCTP